MSTKVTDLTALATTPEDSDELHIVDVSDTTGTAAGTSKRIDVSVLMGKAPVQSVNGDTGTVVLDIEDLDNVTTATPSNGNVLNWQTNQWVLDTRLTTLYQEFKAGTSSTVTDGANSNSEMELTGTTAKIKTGVTGITITETSPGDIEFNVATDASGSTDFTALHLDGTTTANQADFIVKQGTSLAIEGTGSATAKFRNTNSGNTLITVPASTGTMALTSDITAAPVDSVNGATGTVVLDADDISDSSTTNKYTTAAEISKLSGIEANADVTDATNVAAAGALMASSAQLTGNLDVQANEVNTTTSNGNIKVAANGTGVLEVRGNTGSGSDDNPGAIKLNCAENTHGITIKSPAHSVGATYTLTLPDDDGTANQVLETDGSGNLSWVDQSGGSGGGIKFATAFGGRWEFGTSETGANKWIQLGGYNGMSFYNWTNSQTATLSADPPTVGTSTLTLSEYLYGKYSFITPAAGTLKIRATLSWDTATAGMAGEIMDWICLKMPSSNLDGTYNGSYAATVCAYGSVTCPSSNANIAPSVISIDGGSVSAGDCIMTLARFEDATFTSTQRVQSNVSFSVE